MSSRDNSQVTLHELGTTDFQTFLDNFGGKLVDAVVVSIRQNMVDDAAFVRWRAVLAQVLDTPVAKLTMGDKINACDDFLDGRTLERKHVSKTLKWLQGGNLPFLPQHSSQRCSEPPSCLSPPVRLHATYHEELR